MVSFVYAGTDKRAEEAKEVANILVKNVKFLEGIGKMEKFDFSTLSGAEIASWFQPQTIEIKLYKPFNCFSRALGKSLKNRVVYLNARKLDRPVESLVNTIIHELIHVLDVDEKCGHGDSWAKGKEDSAPYKIGGFAEYFLMAGKTSF